MPTSQFRAFLFATGRKFTALTDWSHLNHTAAMVALTIVLTSAAFGAQQFFAPQDPQAIRCAQKSLALMGANALTADQTIRASGTLTLEGEKPIVFPVVIKSRGTRLLRMELTTGKGLRLFIVNNGHGIIRQPDGSVMKLLSDNMAAHRVNYIPALSLIAEYDRGLLPVFGPVIM